MVINQTRENDQLTVTVSGRLDTTTAPQLEAEMKDALDDVKELVIDFSDLDYISSAGLRILLAIQKKMNKQGSMLVKGSNETIKEIFEVTGFTDILRLE